MPRPWESNRSVSGARDLKRFIDLPFRLHANSPQWVPPLKLERRLFLNRRLNAFFSHGEAEYFLALRDGRVVGRITAQVNSAFNDAEVTPPVWRDPETIALAKTLIGWLIFAAVLLWLYRKIKPAAVDYFFPPVDEEAERSARLDAERAAMEAARDRETNRYQDNLTRARDMATKDPRAVAMVLRSWMASQDEQSPK